jgi:hypothetical protein
MATARSIMRGTFRLSIVVAVLAAGYGFYTQWSAYSEARDRNLQMVLTLECGSKVSPEALQTSVNQYGLFDLGKVGCANRQFWASSDELLKARNGVMMPEWTEPEFRARYAGEYSLTHALIALFLVNLLGLAFIALRAVFGWIASGYRSSS